MDFFQPIICDFHGNFEDPFELLDILFFNTPVEIIFSKIHGKIGRRLLINSREKTFDFFLTLVCHILRRIVQTQISNNPLIIISKGKIICSVDLVPIEKYVLDLFAHLF